MYTSHQGEDTSNKIYVTDIDVEQQYFFSYNMKWMGGGVNVFD